MRGTSPFLLRLLVVSTVFSCLSADAITQEPFRSSVDRVRVDVLVTDRGRPVTGLSASDFVLLDNDVPQRFELVSSDEPVSVVILVDVSYSTVAYGHLATLQKGAAAVLNALQPGEQVALMTFARGARLVVAPTTDASAIRRGLSQLADTPRRRSEATALWDAVFWAAAVARQGAGRPLVVVLSDGGDNASWLTRRQPSEALWVAHSKDRAVDTLVGSGIVVVVIMSPVDNRSESVADDVYGPLLSDEVAERTGGESFAATARDLQRRVDARFAALRAGYVLAFTPADERDGKWHTLKVRLANRRGSVKARPGYLAVR